MTITLLSCGKLTQFSLHHASGLFDLPILGRVVTIWPEPVFGTALLKVNDPKVFKLGTGNDLGKP